MVPTIAMCIADIPATHQHESRLIVSQVGFVGTVILMMKTQIGLGVLAIPSALNALGMVPGVICLVVIAIITTWSGYVIGTFKLQHRQVYSIDDAGGIMFGLVGRSALSVGFCLCTCFANISHASRNQATDIHNTP